jgi:L-malate glycosyltransferase
MFDLNEGTGRLPGFAPSAASLDIHATPDSTGALGQMEPETKVPAPRPVIGEIVQHLSGHGAGMFAAELARSLSGQFRFVFLCLEGMGELGESLAAEGFSVVDLHRRLGLNWPVSTRIGEAVRYFGIELLHTHQYVSFHQAARARGFRGQPPILYTEHGRQLPDKRRWLRRLANYFLFHCGDRIVAAGDFVKQALVEGQGIDERKIEVIPDGIDPQQFAARRSAACRLATRAALGLTPEQPLILQVARFDPVKDHVTAIRALAEVIEEIPSAVLALAGDGQQRPHIESLVQQLEIAPNVRFLGERGDIPQLMAAADVLLLSSVNEGVSATLLEAMANRLPIVATAVGGNAELVGQGEAGLLSPRGRPAPLADNILRLLRDPLLRLRLGQQGYQRLLHRFTHEQMQARYAALYHRMAAV